MEGHQTRQREASSALVPEALVVFGLACVLLLGVASFFEPGRLHVSGRFADQAGYITTARTWTDTGQLTSGLTYPAYVERPGWRLYMPGHYAALACSFFLFGYGLLQALLPSLLAFALSCVGVYLTGAHLFGRRAGELGALFFMLYPPAYAYAFTAMAELTLTAAAVVAWTVFAFLPRGWRPWLAPLLLVIPFLFRETGALYVIPFACVVLLDGVRWNRRVLTTLFVLVASPFLLKGVLAWQVADGKMEVPLSWVTQGRFDYYDGTLPAEQELSAAEWRKALSRNVARNRRELSAQAGADPWQPSVTGAACLGLLFLVAGAGFVRRRDPWTLGALVALAVMVLLTFLLYDVKGQKLVRGTIFLMPPLALAAGAALARIRLGMCSHWPTWAVRLAAVLLVLPPSVAVGLGFGRELVAGDADADAGTAFLEGLRHDDARWLLVHPFFVRYSLDYAVRHYPVPWSFVPARLDSLALLERRHPLGTVILTQETLEKTTGQSVAPMTIMGGALLLREKRPLFGNEYLVYQAP